MCLFFCFIYKKCTFSQKNAFFVYVVCLCNLTTAAVISYANNSAKAIRLVIPAVVVVGPIKLCPKSLLRIRGVRGAQVYSHRKRLRQSARGRRNQKRVGKKCFFVGVIDRTLILHERVVSEGRKGR